MSHLVKLLEKASEVREQTLQAHSVDQLESIASGFNSWLLDRPSPGPSPIWANAIFECNVLAEDSFFSAVHGLYEQANSALRNLLDGFLARMYWDIRLSRGEIKERVHEGRKTNEYALWELGLTDKFPGYRRYVRPTLLSHSLISAFNDRYEILATTEAYIKQLNLYVHNRPKERHYDGATRSSTINIQFSERHFHEWFDPLSEIHLLVGTYSILINSGLLESNVGKSLQEVHPVEYLSLTEFLGSIK